MLDRERGCDFVGIEKDQALKVFTQGGNCCQAVLAAFCEKYDLPLTQVMRVAAGLGGGVKCGEICGTVSAAAIVVGLKYGAESAEKPEVKMLCTEKTREITDAFRSRHGSLICRALLAKGSMVMPGEKINGHEPICFTLVEDAVNILKEREY